MDILSHTLTGVAVGTVVSSFSKKGFKRKLLIILVSGFGGALPDFDAFSLWSKFDATVGQFLGLSHSGAYIYFGKLWYSHHGALHSVTLGVLLPLLFCPLVFGIKKVKNKQLTSLGSFFNGNLLLIIGFSLGFCLHLLEDTPTPHCVWGGVRLLFPSEVYIGGFGKIWWWNNYDIFLLIVAVILLNALLHLLNNWFTIRIKVATISVFIFGLILSLYQVNTRGFDFNYVGHTSDYNNYEQKSKDIQKDILGETLYGFMVDFDNSIGLNF